MRKILFYIYLIILFWGILFKFNINYNNILHIRSINLIPVINIDYYNEWQIKEILFNIIIFIPLGYFLSKYLSISKVIIISFLLSLFFEIIEYIFFIGCTDINDIISNVVGAIIGIKLNGIINKMLESKL